jgi:hypothetical protein
VTRTRKLQARATGRVPGPGPGGPGFVERHGQSRWHRGRHGRRARPGWPPPGRAGGRSSQPETDRPSRWTGRVENLGHLTRDSESGLPVKDSDSDSETSGFLPRTTSYVRRTSTMSYSTSYVRSRTYDVTYDIEHTKSYVCQHRRRGRCNMRHRRLDVLYSRFHKMHVVYDVVCLKTYDVVPGSSIHVIYIWNLALL